MMKSGSVRDTDWEFVLEPIISKALAHSEVTNVLSIGSTSNFNISVVLAQRQVQADQAQVEQTNAQLRRDQAQLSADVRKLAVVEQQAERAAQVEGGQAQRAGLNKLAEKAAAVQPPPAPTPAPQPASAPAPQTQVNTSGQTIGQVIDVVA